MTLKYLRCVSDLHTEFMPYELPELETDIETVLILAGDIGCGIRGLDFIKPLSIRFPYVIYVLGNHEYYGKDIELVRKQIQIILDLEGLRNIFVVDEAQKIEIEGLKFVAGTLWTNFDNNNHLAHARVRNGLNDYRCISKGDKRLDTHDTYEIFNRTIEKFSEWIDHDTIIITHHMPSLSTIADEYRGQDLLNFGFVSDLDKFINSYAPKFWFFGHGHNSNDHIIGTTRLVSNPRGYAFRGPPENVKFDPNLIFEI